MQAKKPASIISTALMCALAGAPAVRANIIIKMVDDKNQPIAGVSCSQNGNAAAVSDANGDLNLNNITGIAPRTSARGEFSMNKIPLTEGEKAQVTVINTKGQTVMNRELIQGQRIEFSSYDKGVFFVKVSSRDFSTSGRVANVGKGISFEGVGFRNPVIAAKTAAAGGVAVTCSKSGLPSQIYQLQDGSTNTINFMKLNLVPLFDQGTQLEPEVIIETPTAIITRLADRGRDRHAREDNFHLYDHFLGHYWLHRTATIELIDEIAKGGKSLKLNVVTQWPLSSTNARAFYRGLGTCAEYNSNFLMTKDPTAPNTYHTEYTMNPKNNFAPIKIGDRFELEVSQFLDAPPEGRANYYGTVYLYIVGQGGMVPWEPHGHFGDGTPDHGDSYPLPEETWLGGRMTLPQQTSNEPLYHFIEMSTNLAPTHGQDFVLGRRVDHTSFVDGTHDEPDNDPFMENAGLSGPHYVNASCNACHANNGAALPPAVGAPLTQYVVKVGDGNGNPHPYLGGVLQPQTSAGATGEGGVSIGSWTEANGLRKPNYVFTGAHAPTQFSARRSPRLVGMGLLEAIKESDIQALADPDDKDGDGISGRMRVVNDYNNLPRLGRFGWKAGKPTVETQIAGAFNTDMGVMSSVYPTPDCGSQQGDCGKSGAEVADSSLHHLVDYIELLGIRAQRNYSDADVVAGKAAFASIGCTACHVSTFTTSAYAEKAEVRNQTIHPYTDLLLHDMGPGLADNLPEGDASGAEWRTPPLWGIGLDSGVSGGEAYLHDGRARTLQEAILWHAGEADGVIAKYKALPQSQQDAIIKFLKSI